MSRKHRAPWHLGNSLTRNLSYQSVDSRSGRLTDPLVQTKSTVHQESSILGELFIDSRMGCAVKLLRTVAGRDSASPAPQSGGAWERESAKGALSTITVDNFVSNFRNRLKVLDSKGFSAIARK